MSHNSYFQFKQFRVGQNHSAMRVGTDGVLLGAWTEVKDAVSILDIGTGTGVIALMLAQRSTAMIDAIDIEKGAIIDASTNFSTSPWSGRLESKQLSLKNFTEQTSKKYDCIVCNPPFFQNAVHSKEEARTLARHNHSLTFYELANSAAKLLSCEGRFNVILPAEAEKEFQIVAANFRLFTSRVTRVKPKPSRPVKRVLMEFRLDASERFEDELTIETETHHEYTPEFIRLVKSFYLNF